MPSSAAQAELTQACRDAAGKTNEAERRAQIDAFHADALGHVAQHAFDWLSLPAAAFGGTMSLPFLQQPAGALRSILDVSQTQ